MAAIAVVDASALLDLVVGGPHAAQVDRALRGAVLAAPAHLDAEVLSALARLHRAGSIAPSTVDDALDDLAAAPITRYPAREMTGAAWRVHANVAMRDALYVVLAAGLGATLVTVDARLARACAAHDLCDVALAA